MNYYYCIAFGHVRPVPGEPSVPDSIMDHLPNHRFPHQNQQSNDLLTPNPNSALTDGSR